MTETPETGGYLVAAYVAVAAVLLSYVASLVVRARLARGGE